MRIKAHQLIFPFRHENKALGKGFDRALTEQAALLAQGLNLPKLAKRLQVCWNPRMRSSAGRATWPHGLIELNPRLLDIAKQEVQRTLRHELAHLVAYERSRSTRIDGHGKEWREACIDLGIPDEKSTHQLPLPTRKLERQWRYLCAHCGTHIDRVHRYKGKVACYTCCRKHSGGQFNKDYLLKETRLESSQDSPLED